MNSHLQEEVIITKINDYSKIMEDTLGNSFDLSDFFTENEVADLDKKYFKRKILSRLLIKKTICKKLKITKNFYKEIEIINNKWGKPTLSLSEKIKKMINESVMKNFSFSITHSRNYVGVLIIF
ncbi:MAG: hypothetical protein MJB14_22020 [Spirochaetes bacterium]|nr:hypothetical protein [Spirochaetota bacterium]